MLALLLAGTLMAGALLTACSGGGGGGEADENAAVDPPVAPADCGDRCSLSRTDVEAVIGQAVAEARALEKPATVAVVDRVGNVLGIFRMTGADEFVTVTSTHELGGPVTGGLEGLNFIPATLAAIAKAITGAYLSTGENAFTTRTASQIIQENFNPGEQNVPSGPLFGVQFSQLPCSDFSQRFMPGASAGVGPRRSPLGLSADPGGLPLYINGHAVGGVGVVADSIYGLDKVIGDFDSDIDELIATAATVGYAAPTDIRADRITIVGKTARFSDARVSDLVTGPGDRQAITTLQADDIGDYVQVPGYFDSGTALAGTVFGLAASGIRPADSAVFADADGDTLDAFIFVDAGDTNRYPATDASDTPAGDVANRLTAAEVQVLLNEAIGVANESRAQIRVPPGVQARVTVSVVDTNGVILGMARTRDGPVFGADVSLQKARTAALFSGTGRKDGNAPAELLRQLPAPLYLRPLPTPVDISELAVSGEMPPSPGNYVAALQSFLGIPAALEATGDPVAFSDRAGGNLSRPHYPDGPVDGPAGPLSKPSGEWSVFNVGLQSDLIHNALIHHIAFVFGLVPDVGTTCLGNTGLDPATPFTVPAVVRGPVNGIQIFPGSVPIYRGDVLVGGIGVSGDGVDQDDMISFLGVHRAGIRLDTGLGNAPAEIRADRIEIPGQQARLRYVNCPQLPFIGSNATEVCDGL
jgi:uncharacterized protein GlcG (DUF336 family)